MTTASNSNNNQHQTNPLDLFAAFTSLISSLFSIGIVTAQGAAEAVRVGYKAGVDSKAGAAAAAASAASTATNMAPLVHEARTRADSLGQVASEQAAEAGAKAQQLSDHHKLQEIPQQAVAQVKALAATHGVEDKVRAAALKAKGLDAKHNGGKLYEAYKTGLAFMSMINNKESREAFGRQQMASLNARYHHQQQQQQQQTRASKAAQTAA